MNLSRILSQFFIICLSFNLLSMENGTTSSDSHQNSTSKEIVQIVQLPKTDKYCSLESSKLFENLIDSAQALPECDNLFKTLILLEKDLSHVESNNYKLRCFRSGLFNKLGLKKYKILCEIDKQLKEAGIKDFDVNSKEIYFDILNKGINATNNRWTPMHCAAQLGQDDAVELLIRNGANVNTRDENQLTPLHQAARRGHEATVKLLIKNGAMVNVRDYSGRLPLTYASLIGDKAIVELLKAVQDNSK